MFGHFYNMDPSGMTHCFHHREARVGEGCAGSVFSSAPLPQREQPTGLPEGTKRDFFLFHSYDTVGASSRDFMCLGDKGPKVVRSGRLGVEVQRQCIFTTTGGGNVYIHVRLL